MKNHQINRFLIAITVLILVSLACGSSSNTGTLVTPAPQATTQPDTTTTDNSESEDAVQEEIQPTQEESKPAFEIFEVGDLVEVKDHTIRLNSVEYQGTMLVANFSVVNSGSSDLNMSSMLSFTAKKGDGTKLDQEYFDCGSSSLDGSVLPGDTLRGDICWSGASPEDGIKIYYEADLFSQGAVVWNAVEGIAEELNVDTGGAPQVETFQVGDLVQVQDHNIRLNSLEYQGTVLIADFTVENLSDSDIDMSSMLTFSAKKSDGTKLEQEIFDCGTSSLDGKILSGDRLRGTICWSGANAEDGIKIYYEASLFGEGAIVWDAIAGTAEPLDLPDAQLKVDLFKVGDLVQIQDHTIILNSIEFVGNVLKANFTIENQGAADLNISSILLFYARTRDGSSLEQEIFNCGSSLDGTVIPSDKLTGDICWKGANVADGIKIFYEAELFSSGAVVWIVE